MCVWGATEVESDSGFLAVERGRGYGNSGDLGITHILPYSLIFSYYFLLLFSYKNYYRFSCSKDLTILHKILIESGGRE